MKCDIPVPIERLIWFQKRIGLDKKDLEILNRYQGLFTDRKEVFSEKFWDYFQNIPETKLVLDHEKRRGHLKKAWMQWFESLFKENFSQHFFAFIWRSGLRHVEGNIDQRFVHLGYSFVRQFCLQVVREKIPPADRESVMSTIDKAIDLCLLTETQAYIAGTSQCDMEVVKGISHQVRNPLTVIGGNIIRLKRQLEPESPVHRIYENILTENKRLEKMVTDAGVYSEMFEKEPEFSEIPLESPILDAIERLRTTEWLEKVQLDIELNADNPKVQGSQQDLNHMFYYLLQNSLEAVDRKNPAIKITSKLSRENISFIEVEIFNNGKPPSPEVMDNLFVPFYSSKPLGTGLGLPIAQLAARKNLGELDLEPVPTQGTRCVIKLPISVT
jgi:signal transduction histidine kinase